MRISDWSSAVCSSDLANATFALPWPPWVNMVVNRLSPVTTRLPADSSLSNMPPSWPAFEPSPNTVYICTAESLNISATASEIGLSPGSSSISTNCMSQPSTLEEQTFETQSHIRISYAGSCLTNKNI